MKTDDNMAAALTDFSDETLPTSDQIFKVLKFLRQVPANSCDTSHSEVATSLSRTLLENNFQMSFDWPAWQATAEGMVRDKSLVKSADLATCVKLFTLHLRKERFCEGHLQEMLDCGHIFQILLRLRELVVSGKPLTLEVAEKYQEFRSVVQRAVPNLMNKPGSSLYSPPSTLVLGHILILGTNPGGRADDPAVMTVRQNLEFIRRNTEHHSYAASGDGKRNVLRKRLTNLLHDVGYDIRKVCAINLMFTPSVKATECEYPFTATRCWPVIEWLISTVKPKLILAFGQSGPSPFQYIRKFVLAEKPSTHDQRFGHGKVRLRSFQCVLAGVPTTVVGIPHPSIFDPTGKTVLTQLMLNILRAR
jgi:hypothetical protein